MLVQGSIVLITGANRGIGKAYVDAFLKAGASKIYLGVRDVDSVVDVVSADPDRLIPLRLDVTNAADIRAVAEQAADVNILINNAGILFLDGLDNDNAVESARAQFEVNYIGPLALTQAFAPVLKKNGGGVWITVSSIAGHVAFPGFMTYCASKFAAQSLILSIRTQLAGQGTHVIGVYPGPIDTDMAKEIPMDKFPPSLVAEETLKAIESGAEDVFPDALSQELYQTLRDDPKILEAQMLQMAKESQEAA